MLLFQILFGGVFFVVGALLIIWGFSQRNVAKKAAQTWLSVPGTVINAALEDVHTTNSDGMSTINYRPQVVYQYTVEGQTFTSDQMGFGSVSYDYGTASRKLAAYPINTQVTVYYDPSDPAKGVLKLSNPAGTLLMVMGIIFAVVGVVMFVVFHA